jgi:AcrR family transcriptional regulator
MTTAPRPRAPRLTAAPATRDRIMDAAERLFGDHGFDAVSTRDIAAAAKVNLGLLQYHFKGKEPLFEAVVARRANVVGERRRQLLAAVVASGSPDIEEVLDAFMRPLFELVADPSGRTRGYVLIMSQIGVTNRWLPLLDRHFDEVLRLFLDEMRRSLPGITRDRLLHGMNFAIATMLSAVTENRRLDSLSAGRLPASDLEKVYPNLISFVAAGLRGLAGGPQPKLAPLRPRPRR